MAEYSLLSLSQLFKAKTGVLGWLEDSLEPDNSTIKSKHVPALCYFLRVHSPFDLLVLNILQQVRSIKANTIFLCQVLEADINQIVHLNFGITNLFAVDGIFDYDVDELLVVLLGEEALHLLSWFLDDGRFARVVQS